MKSHKSYVLECELGYVVSECIVRRLKGLYTLVTCRRVVLGEEVTWGWELTGVIKEYVMAMFDLWAELCQDIIEFKPAKMDCTFYKSPDGRYCTYIRLRVLKSDPDPDGEKEYVQAFMTAAGLKTIPAGLIGSVYDVQMGLIDTVLADNTARYNR